MRNLEKKEITISGFSYVRNGINFNYPFLQSIQSVLPICDEFIMVVGDSEDGTREAIEQLNSPKIKIIDSVWDMSLREGGKLFALQSDLGNEAVTGDWALHIQADEIIHENDVQKIKEQIYKWNDDPKVEGLLFPYYHFWGGYNYIRTSRAVHHNEIRAFKTNQLVRSYKDSQGFRKFSSIEKWKAGEKGTKLRVKKIDVPVFHYSYVRPPEEMKKKTDFFHRFWHEDNWLEKNLNKEAAGFQYEDIDRLEEFKGTHPKLMQEIVDGQSWEFEFDPKKAKYSLKYRVLDKITDLTGLRLFEYRNYKKI